MAKRISILILMACLLTVYKSWAGEQEEKSCAEYNLGKVIVTATKTEEYQSEIGSSSTVITAGEMKKAGKVTVSEALRGVPGVAVTQTGSFGGASAVYLRGSDPGYTLVLIDGVKVNDPMKSDRSFDFAHLTTENIERIEVIRGPQSSLYGSDAMAGVINIITKKGEGRPKFEVFCEGGSYNTFRENISLSGSAENMNYSVSASRMDSEGISKSANGSEEDGYRNTAVSSKLGYKTSDNSELNLSLRLTDSKAELDDGAYQEDPNSIAWWRNLTGRVSFNQAINPAWEHTLTFSYSDTSRQYRDEADDVDTTDNTHNWFEGEDKTFEWQNNFSPVDWDIITGGFEYEEEVGFGDGRKSSDRFDRKTVENKSFYLQNQLKLKENLFITPGVRIDDHGLFGTEDTYKISSAYIVPRTKTRIKANWGTAFKAPSLYQLYHPTYGDQSLSPERNNSRDFGFEQDFFGDKISLGLTYFWNDFKNMISWDSSTSKYKNINKAETEGFELGCSFKPAENITMGANYTRVEAKDKNTGKKLTKRPDGQISLDLNWAFIKKANLNLMTSYSGHRWNDASNTQKIKPYSKTDLYVSYDLTKTFQVFGKTENLFDRKYQEAYGYNTAGRSFYTGVKADF